MLGGGEQLQRLNQAEWPSRGIPRAHSIFQFVADVTPHRRRISPLISFVQSIKAVYPLLSAPPKRSASSNEETLVKARPKDFEFWNGKEDIHHQPFRCENRISGWWGVTRPVFKVLSSLIRSNLSVRIRLGFWKPFNSSQCGGNGVRNRTIVVRR
jgi:hypothetical protein